MVNGKHHKADGKTPIFLHFYLSNFGILKTMSPLHPSPGANTGFLRQIMWKQARRIGDGAWEMPRSEVVREAVGKQS